MTEISLREKVDEISEQVSQLESLFSRRLLEDRAKNSLIDELKNYLVYRQDLDTGVAFSGLMKAILSVVDRLENGQATVAFNQSIAEELLEILDQHGLSLIDATGQVNPKIHEVVGIEPSAAVEENQIVAVISQGYTFQDKVLRPAKVIISKQAESAEILHEE